MPDESNADLRTKYIAGNLSDVPTVYQQLLGDDPQKWKEESAALREKVAVDFLPPSKPAPATGGLDYTKVQDETLRQAAIKALPRPDWMFKPHTRPIFVETK